MGTIPNLDSYRNRAVLCGAVGNRGGFYEIRNIRNEFWNEFTAVSILR